VQGGLQVVCGPVLERDAHCLRSSRKRRRPYITNMSATRMLRRLVGCLLCEGRALLATASQPPM